MTDPGAVYNFSDNSISVKFKQKISSTTGVDGTRNVETNVPLKYLSNFYGTLEISIINCEINLILTWYANRIIKTQHLQ